MPTIGPVSSRPGPVPPSPGDPPHVGGGIKTFPGAFKIARTALTVNKTVTGLFAMRRDVTVNESPIYLTAGESRTFTLTFEQASSVSATSAKVYKNGTDSTATNMPSGATSVSGNVVTLPPIVVPTGGERYVVELTATVDGQTLIKAIMLIVRAAGSEL